MMKSLAIPIGPETTRLSDADDSLYLIDVEPFPILLDVRDIRISSLNRAGQVLLPMLLRHGLDATANQLAARHRLDVTTIRRDLEDFVGELERQGFLPRKELERHSLAQSVRRAIFKRLAGFVLRSKTHGYHARWQKSPFACRNKDELRRLVISLLSWGWWSMRVLGWSETLNLWKHELAPTVVPLPVQEQMDAIAVVDKLVREETAARLLLPCACKERALVAAYCLRQLGDLAADVVLGIIPVPFQVHAWSVCEGHVLTDDPERIAQCRPAIRFPLG